MFDCQLTIRVIVGTRIMESFRRDLPLPFPPYQGLVLREAAVARRDLAVSTVDWSIDRELFLVTLEEEELYALEESAGAILGPEWSRVVDEDE